MKKKIIVSMLLLLVLIPLKVEAKTLRDLKNELAALKQKKADADYNKQKTQQELNNVNNNIEATTNKMKQNEENIEKLNKEIAELNEKAKQRELEIKEVMHFLQIANGENAYLEYIFGAKDITDFIYRSAISGQLVSYNDKLIDEYNETIKTNKKKQEDLKKELEDLAKKQEELSVSLSNLGKELQGMLDVSLSIDEEIVAQEKVINYYEKTLSCGLDENINLCGKVPYSGSFVRPVLNGRITSVFGWRCYTRNNGQKYCGYHNGIDIAGGDTRIYAAAPGTVAAILPQQSCGGNMLFIHHNVGGNYYTTAYFHVKNINVRVGDYVDRNTIVATMGGGSDTWWYDKCTTGQHLHFAVATGLYMKEYTYWSTYTARNINPTSVVNFPAPYVWFSNRITRY